MPPPIAPSPAKPTRSSSSIALAAHLSGGVLDRLEDPQIARAAAQVPGERLAQLLAVGTGMLAQVCVHRHEEARRAEAALERMGLVERALERVQAGVAGEPLDGGERAAVRLDREHQAGADGLAVELHGAGAADALLTAHLRAGEAGAMPDEVRQQRARLDLALVAALVDLHAHPHARASSMARRASSVHRARRCSSSTCSPASAAASRGDAPSASARSTASARAGAGPAPISATPA